jgi:hypothetical protein
MCLKLHGKTLPSKSLIHNLPTLCAHETKDSCQCDEVEESLAGIIFSYIFSKDPSPDDKSDWDRESMYPIVSTWKIDRTMKGAIALPSYLYHVSEVEVNCKQFEGSYYFNSKGKYVIDSNQAAWIITLNIERMNYFLVPSFSKDEGKRTCYPYVDLMSNSLSKVFYDELTQLLDAKYRKSIKQ